MTTSQQTFKDGLIVAGAKVILHRKIRIKSGVLLHYSTPASIELLLRLAALFPKEWGGAESSPQTSLLMHSRV